MIRRFNELVPIVALATMLALSLSGCLSDGQTDDAQAGPNPGDPPPSNSAPTISGSPGSSVLVGDSYSFTPTATDSDGDALTFSVENLPSWADFETTDGTLSGVPNLGDEGTYSNIVVSVSDGSEDASLPAFSVNVTQTATGSATLSWTPPTENEDGSTLTDLSGYRIYYGVSQGNYPNQITINTSGVSTYVVENLSPNTYYFVATAVNSSGFESDYSNVATKTVN